MSELSDYKRLVEKPHIEQLRRTIDRITAERDALQHDIERLRKALEKIRDDHYLPSDLEIRDCEQPEMIWQSIARRALATLRVTDAER